jgi:chromosome segregation ATPase
MIPKLESTINSLTVDEQARLSELLIPAIEARQAMIKLASTQAAEDLEEKELLQERPAFMKKKAELKKLDAELAAIRKKISDHTQQRLSARNKFKVAKTRFEAHY